LQPCSSTSASTRSIAAQSRPAGSRKDFSGTVAPFVFRGVTPIALDSVMVLKHQRLSAWKRLANDLDRSLLTTIAEEIRFAEATSAADRRRSAADWSSTSTRRGRGHAP
jgi:acrylyl-CoA reductase (NADPH)